MEAAIMRWTQKGWVIVSQTETAAQLTMPRRLGCPGMFLAGMLPAAWAMLLFFGGSNDVINLFLALGLMVLGVMGMLASIGEYFAKPEEVVYLTTEHLRESYPLDAPNAAVRVPSSARPRCSFCTAAVGQKATQCRTCQRHLLA